MERRFVGVKSSFGRLAALAIVLLLIGAISLNWTGQARAHAEYDHSNPASGATVDSPPAIVEAWFTEDLDSNGTTMTVTGPDGASVDKGDAAVDLNDPERRHLTVSLKDGLGPGTYTVSWTSVSSEDGDTATGSFQFTVAGSATPCASASPMASPSVATPQSGTPVAGADCGPIVVDAGYGTPAAAEGMTVTLGTNKTKAGPVTLTVSLQDSSGAAINQATVELAVKSLDMDMGTSTRTAAAYGNGTYAADVNMGMGGAWQVDVQVTLPGKSPVVIRYKVTMTGPG
jgi:methionine-rich copper-binding protein CopC